MRLMLPKFHHCTPNMEAAGVALAIAGTIDLCFKYVLILPFIRSLATCFRSFKHNLTAKGDMILAAVISNSV